MSKYSVKKPVTVLMCILIVIVLGVYSLSKQSLALFPNMNLPYVVVVTPYAGASAETVADEVTDVIESQVTSMNNFASVTSTSSQHYSMVMIEFNEDTNMDSVMIDLRSKLDNITFPEGVTKPTILQVSPDMLPVMTASVSVDYEGLSDDEAFIKATQYIKDEILERLSRVEGVAEVSTQGAAEIVIQLDLDSVKLAKYGYTTEQVLELIEEQNQDKLIGVAVNNGEICMLHLGNSIENIEEFRNLPLPFKNSNGDVEVVLLSELVKSDSDIKFVNNNSESYSKVNGKQTITLSFQMQNGAVITDVTNGILEELDKISSENSDFSYSIVSSQGEYIELAVGSVIENLIYGALLAIIVLILFLRDYRPTLIVGLSIPISVIATFMCMFFAGINLNMLSMGGLALGVGMLVDNAIVVIENIFRLRKEGKSKIEAAIEGAKGVGAAITSSTITTIIVFVPILFIGGTVRDVFANMAYTISFSLICSLVISLTMVPAMASKILIDSNHCPKCEGDITNEDLVCPHCGKKLRRKVKVVKEDKKVSKLEKSYDKVIRWSLNHKLVVILIPVVLFALTLGLTLAKGFVLLPSTDEGTISATVEVDASLEYEQIAKYADKLVEKLRDELDEEETVSASFGESDGLMALVIGSDESTIDSVKISLTIKLLANHKKSTEYYAERVNEIINKFNTAEELAYIQLKEEHIIASSADESDSITSYLTSSGVNIQVKGYDLEKMEIVANRIAEIVASVDGTFETSPGVKGNKNNLKIYVNKYNAAKLGLTQEDFVESVNLFLNSGSVSLVSESDSYQLSFNGISYDISMPSSLSFAGVDLSAIMKLMGSYEDFLQNFVVFDRETIEEINNSGKSLYTVIPIDKEGNPIVDYSDPNVLKNVANINVIVDLGYYMTPELDENGDYKYDANNNLIMKKEYFSYFETNYYLELLKAQVSNPELPEAEKQILQTQIMGIEMMLQNSVSFKTLAKGKLLGDENDPNCISTIKPVTGYSSISSDGNYRYFTVSSAILEGYNVTNVSNEVIKKVDEYLASEEFAPYKDIIKIEYAGENEDIMTVVEQMIIALFIGILLVYMVMAIQFQSIIYPFIVLGTLPLAFTGGFAFILIFNMEFSIVAIMGLIVLVGVAVNNGIVLIDYINQLREEGYTIRNACIEASKTRLRPILMTALTTIVALIFSAIGLSNGAELLQPLALTAIGGLIFATALTLIVIPALYMVFNYRKVKKEDALEEETNVID